MMRICLLLLALLLACGCQAAKEEPQMANPKDITVAAIFYQWFGYEHDAERGWPSKGGLGTFHWNDVVNNEFVTGFVANSPEIGYYASDDEATIAWQLQKMQEAGIDTIIVSWWGWGDANMDGNITGYIEARSQDALIRLLNYIKLNGLSFKVALMVEPWPDIVHGSPQQPGTARNLSAVRKQMVLDYVWDNIYSVYPGLTVHWDGKPLLATVGELYFDLNEDAPDDRFTLRSFRFKAEDIDPGNAWNWIITEPLPYFQAVDNTVILSPRYDEWFLAAAHPKWWEAGAWGRTEPLRRDPYLTENLYDFQWRQVYDRREETDLIILWAWNSWMEQLYIEPDNEQGAAPAGDMLLRKTAWYARRLMSGAPFELMEPDWVSVQDFRSVLTPIAPAQLNLESDAEVDQLLHRIIQQAQSHVATYLNRTFGDISIPDAVREVTLRVASSIYNYMIATKSGNLVRFGEVGVDVLSNTVFTDAMRRDLRPFRKAPTIGVWSP